MRPRADHKVIVTAIYSEYLGGAVDGPAEYGLVPS